MVQCLGAWLIRTGLLTWLASDIAKSEGGQAIAKSYMVAYLIALVAYVTGLLSRVLNWLCWMFVVILVFFAAGFGLARSSKRRMASTSR